MFFRCKFFFFFFCQNMICKYFSCSQLLVVLFMKSIVYKTKVVSSSEVQFIIFFLEHAFGGILKNNLTKFSS